MFQLRPQITCTVPVLERPSRGGSMLESLVELTFAIRLYRQYEFLCCGLRTLCAEEIGQPAIVMVRLRDGR